MSMTQDQINRIITEERGVTVDCARCNGSGDIEKGGVPYCQLPKFYKCPKCNGTGETYPNYSTWNDYGVMLEEFRKKDWWGEFIIKHGGSLGDFNKEYYYVPDWLLNPKIGSLAIAEFLKGRKS
jgi:hypothetical protein